MPDDELRIKTRVDLSGLNQGMEQAASVTKQASQQMADALGGATSASEALKEAQVELAGILKAGGGTIGENNALWSLYQETLARVAELQQQVAATATTEAAATHAAAAAAVEATAANDAQSASLIRLRPRLSANSSGLRLAASGSGDLAAIAGIAAVALGVHMADSAMTADLALKRMNEDTGISVVKLAELQEVARTAGVNGDDLAGTFTHLQEKIALVNDGNRRAINEFRQLGISEKDLHGGHIDLISLMSRISLGLHAQTGNALAAAAATELLGAKGRDLTAVLADNSVALDAQLGQYAQLAGLKQSNVQVSAQLQVEEAKLTQAWQSAEQGVLPAFTEALHWLYIAFDKVATVIDKAMVELSALLNFAAHPTQFREIGAQAKAAVDELDALLKSDEATMEGSGPSSKPTGSGKGGGALPLIDKHHAHKKDPAIAAAVRVLNDLIRADQEAAHKIAEAWKKSNEAIARSAQKELDRITEGDHKAAADMQAISRARAMASIADTQQAALAKIAIERDRVNSEAQLGTISAQQKVAALAQLEQREFQIKQQALQRKQALVEQYAAADPTNPKYVSQLIQLHTQIEALTQTHELKMQQLSEQAAVAHMKRWTEIGQTINRTFDQSIKGVIMGTQSLTQAWRRMGLDMLASTIDTLEKIIMKHIIHAAAATAVHGAAVQIQTAQTAAGAAEQTAIGFVATMKKVTQDAVKAATGAYQALVGIPIIGPIIAPPAAAATFAAVEGFGALASASGGYWQVPGDIMANIHKDEMVLPSWAAGGLRDMIEGGGGKGGSTTNVHIHAADAKSFADMLQRHGSTLAMAIKRLARNGGL